MKIRRIGVRLVLVAGVVAVCAGVMEGGARLAGYRPWPRHGRLLGSAEGLHQVDPKLGWRKTPGVYSIERFGRNLEVRHWDLNRRATSDQEMPRASRALLVGGSFTYGLGLSDHETFAWQMQQRYPRFEWVNLATSGYGTFQALLSLEEYLESEAQPPMLVVYGYNWFHAERNVAADSWQYAMAVSSPAVRLPLPFVAVEADGTLRKDVHVYPDSWLKRYSAAIALMERAWNKWQVRGRADQAREATQKLLLELDAVTGAHGSTLLVMIMGRRDDQEFLAEHGIAFVDCMPHSYAPEMSLPDDHPSALRNEFYARCLGDWLEQNEMVESP